MSNSLGPHGLQHARLPCPSLSPRVCPNSCPLSQWCYLTLSSSARSLLLLPYFFQHRVFSSESAFRIRWPKYWSFTFSNRSSNEYSGLISFGFDWFDLLAVQGTYESSPASQFKSISLTLRLLYGPAHTSLMTTGKTIALTIQTFVNKVMSLLFKYAV